MRASFTLSPQMPMIPHAGRRGLVRRFEVSECSVRGERGQTTRLDEAWGYPGQSSAFRACYRVDKTIGRGSGIFDHLMVAKTGKPFWGAVTWLDDRSGRSWTSSPCLRWVSLRAAPPLSKPRQMRLSPAAAPAVCRRKTFASAKSAEVYRIATGDILDVNVFRQPDLSRTVDVDGAGQILLPLIGAMRAAGKTVRELEAEITRELGAKYLQSPQVSVAVKDAAGQRVTVEGASQGPRGSAGERPDHSIADPWQNREGSPRRQIKRTL